MPSEHSGQAERIGTAPDTSILLQKGALLLYLSLSISAFLSLSLCECRLIQIPGMRTVEKLAEQAMHLKPPSTYLQQDTHTYTFLHLCVSYRTAQNISKRVFFYISCLYV